MTVPRYIVPKTVPVRVGRGYHVAHTPTDETRQYVKEMAAIGITQPDMCRVLGFGSNHTLMKYYRDEIEIGVIQANHRVGLKLMEKIDKGDIVAIIWWMKNRMGWKNADDTRERNGAMVVPIKINVNFATQNVSVSKE